MSKLPRPIGLLLLPWLLSACDGGPSEPPAGTLSLELSGFVERGAVVHLAVGRAGAPVPAAEWSLSAQPADAVTVLGGDSLRLNRDGDVTLTVNAGAERGARRFDVARPPVVFFDRVVAGNRDIYRVDLDGQNLTRLTTDPGTDQDPTVGGGRVVFVSFRGGTADLWSVPAEGGTSTRLEARGGNSTSPALSRNGQRLAFAYDGEVVSKLWTAAGDGDGAARATAGFGFSGSIESSPSWSPDGSRLVFMSTAGGSADIYDFAPGGAPAILAPSDLADVEPAWSPDGQAIAFVSTRGTGGGSTDLYIVRLATGELTQVTTGPQTEGQPSWTPDGLRLVFTDFEGGTRRLRWLEVSRPGITHPIPTGEGRAENPAVEP